ncbi:hypothetical protein [Nitrosomonas sp.]|uniref:hypothetical protein n=1 Tax=Nitrosomonas sp. TaxID=42353 RepID=UPI0025D010AD|nr:hypothetical protein [Nitrosomonas sp.]
MFNHKLFRFNIQDQLPETKEELDEYLKNLKNLLSDQQQEPIFAHLYENLSILDAKAASLLQFNSILLAVLAIFLTADAISSTAFFITIAGIFLILISSYLLLDVVWVHWSAADHMHIREDHELKLLEVRRSRTRLYRIAWNFSRGSLLMVAAVVIFELFLKITEKV